MPSFEELETALTQAKLGESIPYDRIAVRREVIKGKVIEIFYDRETGQVLGKRM